MGHIRDKSDVESSSIDATNDQSLTAEHDSIYRTCSWQKTAALLFSEYICLAILSFPWSYSVLGLVPGIILTIVVAGIVLYTSLILWRFCLAHPEVRDVTDIGVILFSWTPATARTAYALTSIFFILNNTFIQALHVLVGAKLINTFAAGSTSSANCTVFFSAMTAIACFLVSLPKTLSNLSYLGTFSAVTMGIAVLLAIIFAGIESHPFGYVPGQEPMWTVWPISGTTYVSGMSAWLNITYTLVGQITLPSFIAEMKEPKDFPKALWAVTICEIIVFTLCGSLMYYYIGNQYITAPAFGSLITNYKKASFAFAIPTIVYLGALYASVSARFIFFRLPPSISVPSRSTPVRMWTVWAGILAITWIVAFVIAEAVPFFSDLLSLMSALFDGWFGFIFWGMAYLTLYPGARKWASPLRSLETLWNYFLIIMGIYMLTAGTYVAVDSIILSYQTDAVGRPFTCVSNGI